MSLFLPLIKPSSQRSLLGESEFDNSEPLVPRSEFRWPKGSSSQPGEDASASYKKKVKQVQLKICYLGHNLFSVHKV